MQKLLSYITVSLLLLSLNGIAQKSDIGNWLIYFGNQKINTRWNWHNEAQYRNYNFIGDLNQLVLRTGLGYNLSENNNNILLGYGYIYTETYGANGFKTGKNEHRIFQQFITKQQFNSFFITHRYRIEERFITNDNKVRFRYFLAVNKPINKKQLIKNAIYLSAYNEIFLHANTPVFDRNRLYGAVGYCFNKFVRLELGYMTQILENKNQSQFQFVLFNNLPF